MSKYLLVAEADKIQDFLFRASRLSEIVGGSQLLTRFCREIVRYLLTEQEQKTCLLVHDGGKFIFTFNNQQRALEVGHQLAEAYHRATDGSITITPPIPYNNRPFQTVYAEADEQLRKAKRTPYPSTITAPHLPYIAICASCGTGLALTHKKLNPKDTTEKANYLCRACQTKLMERQTNIQTIKDDYFLWPFVKKIADIDPLEFTWTTRPKHVSEYDPQRRYVAYLQADGNDMGQIFSQCSEQQIKVLSNQMLSTLRSCLVEVTKILKKQNEIEAYKVPVLPLIMGGDDLFALIPAPWALSFAYEFSQQYHTQITNLLQEKNLYDPAKPPTVAISIVICKETYPHTLAHEAGKQLLDEAKQVGKSKGIVSTVSFSLIVGVKTTSMNESHKVHPTLRPYLIQANDQTPLPDNIGLSLHRLIDLRFELQSLPKRRLHQLREYFDQIPERKSERQIWVKRLNQLVQRVSRHEQDGRLIKKALTTLGQANDDYLYSVKRPIDSPYWDGHGLPDLIQMWDFAFDLNRNHNDYEA